MARKVRTSSAILLTLAAVVALLGVGLCGKPTTHADDFSGAIGGALLLLIALVLAIVGFARGLFLKGD